MRDRSSEKGASLLIFSLLLSMVMLPMLGLCIDVSFIYFAKARLYSAVDAAALAGGRSLSVGLDFSSQKANAENVAGQYFRANYPNAFLGSQNIVVNAEAKETGDLYRTVSVNATADVPLYFMRMVGISTAAINASAQTSRRDVNIMLVLDRSGSMSGACGTMRSVATNFVSGFTNGRDSIGLVSFVATANLDFSPTKYFKTQTPKNLEQVLSKLICSGSTGSAEALHQAQVASQAAALPGTLNVIIFFTDGYPHGFTATLKKKITSACETPDSSGLVTGALTAKSGFKKPAGRAINQGDPPNVTLNSCSPQVDSIGGLKSQFMGYPVSDGDPDTPDTDAYGNATDLYPSATISDSGTYRTYNLTKNAAGLIDITTGNAWLVSKSTAFDAARKIRAAGITLYTIGLDGNGGIDSSMLAQMANDPSSSTFSNAEPVGRFAYAADAGQLAAAFNSIKSELLRLAE